MKYAFALVGTAASLASAHSVFTTIYINDVSQGDGTCVRMAKDEDPSAPIAGLSSDDMACGTFFSCSFLRRIQTRRLLTGKPRHWWRAGRCIHLSCTGRRQALVRVAPLGRQVPAWRH